MNIPLITSQVGKKGLLIEKDSGITLSPKSNSLHESKVNTKDSFSLENPYVYAVMQKAGIKNRNGRVYSKKLLDREVEKYMEMVKMRAAVGESDHADTSTISVKGISMLVVDLWWEGATLMGKIFVPLTEGFKKYGTISCEADKIGHYLMNDIQIGISSRGVGSLKKEKDYNLVDDDFELICWDWVTMPSTIGSWVYGDYDSTKPHISIEQDIDLKEQKSKNLPPHLQKLFGTRNENFEKTPKIEPKKTKVNVLQSFLNKK